MSFFRLRTVPGNTWPALCEGTFSQVWAAYRTLEQTQWLPPAELESGQLRQIRTLLAHSIAYVPYYRDLLSAAGISPGAIQSMQDFRRIPLLPRRVYQENLASFVAEQLPEGTKATASPQTSGSSGTPTTAFQTNMVNLWWCAFYLRDLQWCGLDPTGTLAVIRSTGKAGDKLAPFLEGVSAPAWLLALQPLIESGSAHLMDITQDHHRQLQWLRGVAPNYLLSYPANLEVLGALVRQEGPLPNLRAIQSISDTLTPETQAAIEAAFGVPVRNTYSCIEAGYLASPCPAGHGLHVHAENVLLEVLDESGQPCEPGQTGRVFLTSLNNFRGPLIRYELGDNVTVGPPRCDCGRGLALLTRVQGKNSPMFRLPDGRLKSSVRLAVLVRKVGGHWQHQVVQKAPDHVVVRLVVDSTWTDSNALLLRQRMEEFFESPLRVDVEIHERLPTPPSGKFQNMVVELA